MTVSPEQILEANTSTQAHINLVRKLLRMAATELLIRGEEHDLSKFSPEEVEMFAVYTPKLKQMAYGSEEYKAALKDMGPGLQHHYCHNRHHPEHFDRGIRGMNLIDVMEMFIDWLASTKRVPGGDIRKSIEINRKRFKIGGDLEAIFRNTIGVFEAIPLVLLKEPERTVSSLPDEDLDQATHDELVAEVKRLRAKPDRSEFERGMKRALEIAEKHTVTTPFREVRTEVLKYEIQNELNEQA